MVVVAPAESVSDSAAKIKRTAFNVLNTEFYPTNAHSVAYANLAYHWEACMLSEVMAPPFSLRGVVERKERLPAVLAYTDTSPRGKGVENLFLLAVGGNKDELSLHSLVLSATGKSRQPKRGNPEGVPRAAKLLLKSLYVPHMFSQHRDALG
jgi:hypothetical protein